jgi:hypothetical protein
LFWNAVRLDNNVPPAFSLEYDSNPVFPVVKPPLISSLFKAPSSTLKNLEKSAHLAGTF